MVFKNLFFVFDCIVRRLDWYSVIQKKPVVAQISVFIALYFLHFLCRVPQCNVANLSYLLYGLNWSPAGHTASVVMKHLDRLLHRSIHSLFTWPSAQILTACWVNTCFGFISNAVKPSSSPQCGVNRWENK